MTQMQMNKLFNVYTRTLRNWKMVEKYIIF